MEANKTVININIHSLVKDLHITNTSNESISRVRVELLNALNGAVKDFENQLNDNADRKELMSKMKALGMTSNVVNKVDPLKSKMVIKGDMNISQCIDLSEFLKKNMNRIVELEIDF